MADKIKILRLLILYPDGGASETARALEFRFGADKRLRSSQAAE